MSSRTRIAVGLASGYLLGRYRKTRWLAMIAAAVAARQLGGAAVRQGAGALGSSPELKQLGEQGREAAVAVLSHQLSGINRRLHDRTEALRQPLSAAPDSGEQPAGGEQDGREQDGPEQDGPEQPDRTEQDQHSGQPQDRADQGDQGHGGDRSDRSDQGHRGDRSSGEERRGAERRSGSAAAGDRDRSRVSGRPGTARGRR